jgi:hypothetical protein
VGEGGEGLPPKKIVLEKIALEKNFLKTTSKS